MKKKLVILGLSLFLVGCSNGNGKNNEADYSTKEAEELLNNGEDLEGKTVEFTVDKLAPTSAFGYNLQTGEHLNFVSAENPKVKEHETVIAKVENVKSVMGSFIIEYKLIENKGALEDSEKESTIASSENKEITTEFNPADYNAAMPTDEFIRDPKANKGKKTKFVARILQETSSDDENGHFFLATTTPEKKQKGNCSNFC